MLVVGGQASSPIEGEKAQCSTARCFENLLICARFLLLTSAHHATEPPPEDEPFDLPEGSRFPSCQTPQPTPF